MERIASVECADYIVQLYGFHEFLDDIDSGRTYRLSSPGVGSAVYEGGVIGAILTRLATVNFEEFMRLHGAKYRTAQEYRHRYLVGSIVALIQSLRG